jgi:hypothetical protein
VEQWQCLTRWILVLKPRAEVTLTLDQFMQARLLCTDTPREVNVHEPPAGPTTFTLAAQHGQTVVFGFRNDANALISTVIRRSGG